MKTLPTTCDPATPQTNKLTISLLSVATNGVKHCLRHTCDSLRHQEPATPKNRLNDIVSVRYTGVARRRQVVCDLKLKTTI
jgi:hypothetical protein